MSKEEYRKHIEDNTICDYLNKIEVKKGDSIFIPAQSSSYKVVVKVSYIKISL